MFTQARKRVIYKKIANYLTPCSSNIPQPGDSQWERKIWWLKKAGLQIGKNVVIDHGFHCLTDLEENIQIDDYVVIGAGVKFWNFNSIRIRAFSLIAADVTFVNGGHNTDTLLPFSSPLIIGRGCWIGNGARIVGELSIGDHVIIGAGSVVIRDIPDCSIVAGVPARVIGERKVPEYVWRTGTRNTFFNSSTFEAVFIENSEDIANQNKFLRDTYDERLFGSIPVWTLSNYTHLVKA
jgi:acetyltransferase-like isoleucine patch superfamily enzyme